MQKDSKYTYNEYGMPIIDILMAKANKGDYKARKFLEQMFKIKFTN